MNKDKNPGLSTFLEQARNKKLSINVEIKAHGNKKLLLHLPNNCIEKDLNRSILIEEKKSKNPNTISLEDIKDFSGKELKKSIRRKIIFTETKLAVKLKKEVFGRVNRLRLIKKVKLVGIPYEENMALKLSTTKISCSTKSFSYCLGEVKDIASFEKQLSQINSSLKEQLRVFFKRFTYDISLYYFNSKPLKLIQ
jgi:hypothetical protein